MVDDQNSLQHLVIISVHLGEVSSDDGYAYPVDQNSLTDSPLSYDGVYLVGGTAANDSFYRQARKFIRTTYTHFKPISARKEVVHLLEEMAIKDMPGVIIGTEHPFGSAFTQAMAQQRFWDQTSDLYHV
ncbi:hypothetical protein [Gracilibacillus phocaeensis]|uniref:hypothetical protein n=1 Tax=Gracilibacillus phocaeensis TaxID=2042304 RepID=UPI0013EF10B1